MTLTADRPVRMSTRPALHPATPQPPAAPAPSSAPASQLVAALVLPDVYRVTDDASIVGYVHVAGPVFVALRGSVYNTSIEVGQCLDLEAAIARLARDRA